MKTNHAKTKIAAVAGSMMMTAMLFTGFGTAAEQVAPEPQASQSGSSVPEQGPNERQMKMQEFQEKAMEKWNSLNEEQKLKLYDLAESRMNADIQWLRELANTGMLDAERVEARIERMQEHMKQMRESGICPFFMGRPGHAHENPDSHS